MRGSKRWPANQAGQRAGNAGHRVDPGDGQRIAGIEIGQETHQSMGEHRLARPRTADHQQVMTTGRSDLQGQASSGLTSHVGQLRPEDPQARIRRRSRPPEAAAPAL